jgi:hypothetical protein
MSNRQVIAVCLVKEYELQLLGAGSSRAWPIDDAPCFEGLLQAITPLKAPVSIDVPADING